MDVEFVRTASIGRPDGALVAADGVGPAEGVQADPNGGLTSLPRARAQRYLAISRLAVALAVFAIGIAILCGVIGYGYARQSDARHAEGQRAALRTAMGEFRDLVINGREVDPRILRMVERSAGLKDLKFETDLADGAREAQPVLNGEGRIAGLLTWEPDFPMTGTLNRLLPLVIGAGVLLVCFAGYSLRQLRGARNDLKASEEASRCAAESDALTGLPNGAKILALLDAVMEARGEREVITFCLIEISGMQELGEQFGAQGRSEIVATSAQRLSTALPSGALCGRVGAGEFAVILSGDIDVPAHLRAVFEAIERPQWLDTVLRADAHAGYAQAPRDANSRNELVRRAELALRAAAHRGPSSIVAFEPMIDAHSSEQQFIRRELPRALAAEALTLHYQPIVESDGTRIVGVEALARWQHSERGDIPPGKFIPVAEQMGLMKTLGAFVLRRALEEARRWPDVYIAVNLSPIQLRDRAIVDLVRHALKQTGVPAQRLMLEITEGVLIDNPEEMVRRIEDLRALGVRIALDDFGSGYSNLGYLQRFPFDKLKIDRSFVAPLGRSANASVILQAMVTLGRALGATVLAEGVETEEQRVLLRLAGCDEMQGFLFARPAPAQAIDRLMAERQNGVVSTLQQTLTA